MKNCEETNCFMKYFEKSIFIRPYYSYIFKSYRMTKSTFYGIFRQGENG